MATMNIYVVKPVSGARQQIMQILRNAVQELQSLGVPVNLVPERTIEQSDYYKLKIFIEQ